MSYPDNSDELEWTKLLIGAAQNSLSALEHQAAIDLADIPAREAANNISNLAIERFKQVADRYKAAHGIAL
jgi:hypothetical protein